MTESDNARYRDSFLGHAVAFWVSSECKRIQRKLGDVSKDFKHDWMAGA
jgi:hypothetical protein